MNREENKTFSRIQTGISYVIMMGIDFIFLRYFFKYGSHYLNADISSEVVLGNLLNKTGEFFSTKWFYSTEIRCFTIVPLYALGIRLFHSWHYARSFALMTSWLLFQFSAIYAVTSFGIKRTAPLFAAVIVIPFSEYYMFLLPYGGFYLGYMILDFLLLGLCLRCVREEDSHGMIRRVFLFFLGIIGGLSGIRMMMFFAVPYVLSLIVMVLYDAHRDDLRSVMSPTTGRAINSGVFAILGILIGYMINIFVLRKIYSFTSYEDALLLPFDLGYLWLQIQIIPRALGYKGGIPFLSINGVSSIATLLLCVVMSALAISQRERFKDKSVYPNERIGCLYIVASAGIGILVNTVLGKAIPSGEMGVGYYMPGFLLMIALVFCYIEKTQFKIPLFNSMLAAVVVMIFTVNGYYTIQTTMHGWEEPIETVAHWLDNNGYTQGFSTFWKGNVLTEASDGKLDIWVVNEDQGMYQIDPWLQETRHAEQLPEGKVFFVAGGEEERSHPELFVKENKVFESVDGTSVYVFDSADALHISL